MSIGGLFCCCKGCHGTNYTDKVVGYSASQHTNIDSPFFVYVQDDLNLLNQIDVLIIFGGVVPVSPALFAAAGDIAAWIATGKRVIFMSEYPGYYSHFDITQVNDFLALLGSGMAQVNNGIRYDCDCNCEWTCTLTDIPLNNDVERILHACTGEVVGGTPVAYTNEKPDVCFIALEQIGAGYLLFSADSNIFSTDCGYNNEVLLNNFLNL